MPVELVMANHLQMFLALMVMFLFMSVIPCDTLNFGCSTQNFDSSSKVLDLIPTEDATFNRTFFPCGFAFGTASSSYQYEGTYNEDGKGQNIWDTYTHTHPERIKDGSNGDLAIDQYHRYKDDIVLMADMGMDAYRFSISWSRVLPNGKISGGVNEKGIEYYNNLINELISKGLEPFVTIFHWDVPQNLEVEYGGFLSSRIIEDFQAYADLCYQRFGDRVKRWITFNEPHSFSNSGYNLGIFAPGRCSRSLGDCEEGNSGTEPYIVSHNQLLAHAAAVKIYREKYQVTQSGVIGITLISHWMVPYSKEQEDVEAAQLALDFMFGWFMDPLTYGDYPSSMKSLVGDRLPIFSQQESYLIKGSYDFIGLNYYTAMYALKSPWIDDDRIGTYSADSGVELTSSDKDGNPIGVKAGSDWLHVCPWGFTELLAYTKKRYNNPTIYVTENGVDEVNDNISLQEALNDTMRIDFYSAHIRYLLKAIIEDGVDVRGYFAWSLMDNFEWNEGYTVRFGINYVDFRTMKRYPKQSYIWFKKFLLNE